MTVADRRRALRQGLTATAAALFGGGLLSRAFAQAEPRTIEITARRFRYEPAEIELEAGRPVVVLIRSLDFVHGMNIPDLGKRLDLVPGRITRLELKPDKAGVIDFVCDNFCGDGHEEMHGRFVVKG